MTLVEEIEHILSEEKAGLHVVTITEKAILAGMIDGSDKGAAVRKVNGILSRKAKSPNSRIERVKNGKGGNKRGCYRWRQERKANRPTEEKITASKSRIKALFPVVPAISTMMLGKAGEFAVVSKLLLYGYNANIMTVDDGIDIIASKEQNVFFVQVKTSTVDERLRCKFAVKKSAYQKGHLLYVRYILVARYGENKFLFIKLTEEKIGEMLNKGLVSDDNNTINIAIRFVGEEAFVYRGREEEKITYYTNNFEL